MKLIFKKAILAFNLSELKEETGLSLEAISKELEMSKSALQGYLSGTHIPDVTTIKKLAHYFDVDICQLTGGRIV